MKNRICVWLRGWREVHVIDEVELLDVDPVYGAGFVVKRQHFTAERVRRGPMFGFPGTAGVHRDAG